MKSVYEIAQRVMDLYEDGDLKDQKLNKKSLTSAPEFKQHLLQPLHNLDASFQTSILQRVAEKEISLKEMKDEAVKFRSLENVRKAFVRCTSSKSWDDAVTNFPAFTSKDRLMKFLNLDFKQSIPDAFRAYCQSALNLHMPTLNGVKTTSNGTRVAVVCGPLKTLSAQKLKENDPAYTGAHLILATIPKV